MRNVFHIGIWVVIACGMMLAGPRASALTLDADTPWVVSASEEEPIARALDDVQRDWYKVLGQNPYVFREPPSKEDYNGPLVYLGRAGDWLPRLVPEGLDGREKFVLRVTKDAQGRPCIVATGSDMRGAIYAAYALSEELLGVDPWYYWTDNEPDYVETIEVGERLDRSFGPPTFKWRGWFINDEDLLHTFARDPMGENVFSLAMWDRIYETVLRLRGNMMVPGTFVFPDEKVHDLCARRGLAINMHHINVVGLVTYRWPDELPYDYGRHPEVLESMWQKCVDAFKDKEIVWTVGYRGRHDRPFWRDAPGYETAEARGALVTKAIAKQVEMVRAAQPDADIISNLWMEGAELYQKGHIKLPEGVTLVWADDGTGIPRDEGRVARGQGVYYHTAMMSFSANQLSEMVPPGRIYSELGRYVVAGATEFFLDNVSDIRSYSLSTDCVMRYVWDASPYEGRTDRENMDAFQRDWSRREYGDAVAGELCELWNAYFDIPYLRRDVRRGEHILNSMVMWLDDRAARRVRDGDPLDEGTLERAHSYLEHAATSLPQTQRVMELARELAGRIPADRRDFYQGNILTPVAVHLHCNLALQNYANALLAYASGEKREAQERLGEALTHYDVVFAALHAAEYGRWSAFYQGERFEALEGNRDRIRRMIALVRGEAPPPVRPRRAYEDICRYQEPLLDNFPLMYPEDSR